MSRTEWFISAKDKVVRYIDRLPKYESGRIWDSLAQLLDFLEHEKHWEGINIKPFHGRMKGAYRIRVGKLRLIIEIEHDEKVVRVLAIDSRGDVYR